MLVVETVLGFAVVSTMLIMGLKQIERLRTDRIVERRLRIIAESDL